MFSGEDGKVARALIELLSGAARTSKIGSLDELMAHLSANRLDRQVQSWRSRGDPLPVRCDELQAALAGTDLIETLVDQTKMPPEDLLDRLSWVLPKVVREVSPFGTDESADAVQYHLEGLRKRLRK